MNGNELGQLIRDRRRELGLTQEELEGLSGVSQTYISQVERGRTTRPLEETLAVFSEALQIPLRDLRVAAGWLEVESVVVTRDAVDVLVEGDVPGMLGAEASVDSGSDAVIRVLPEMIGAAQHAFALRAIDDEWMRRGIVAGTYVVLDAFIEEDDQYREPEDGTLIAVAIDQACIRLAQWNRTVDAVILTGGDGNVLIQARAWRRRVEILGTYLCHLSPPAVTLDEIAAQDARDALIVEE